MSTRLRERPSAASHTLTITGDVLEFRFQRELKNHNVGSRNPHWSVKHRERQAWLALIVAATLDAVGYPAACALLSSTSGLMGATGGLICRCPRTAAGNRRPCRCPPTLRRRVDITRIVPKAANFIRDPDNLMAVSKQILDSVTSAGLLRDDTMAWCHRWFPAQAVSEDGLFWTVVRIAPVE